MLEAKSCALGDIAPFGLDQGVAPAAPENTPGAPADQSPADSSSTGDGTVEGQDDTQGTEETAPPDGGRRL